MNFIYIVIMCKLRPINREKTCAHALSHKISILFDLYKYPHYIYWNCKLSKEKIPRHRFS